MRGLAIANEDLYKSEWWLARPQDEAAKQAADVRSRLERDRDRITHSAGLRRLAGKTQVIGSPWADGFRNRLTHTLEVNQVGRSLARRSGVNEALVEAACLAHDIGHPPFGHAGERRLNDLMRDFGGFDANAQTLRVLRALEVKSSGSRGLNLTRATYWAVLKYPYRRCGRLPSAVTEGELSAKKLAYASDENELDVCARAQYLYDEDLDAPVVPGGQTFGQWLSRGETGLADPAQRVDGTGPKRTLACQIMNWADDVAYAIHDFEDAVLAGFITTGALRRIRDELQPLVKDDVGSYFDDPGEFESSFEYWTIEIDKILEQEEKAPEPGSQLRPFTRKTLGTLIDGGHVEPPAGDDESTVGYRIAQERDERLLVSLLSRLGFELMIRDERVVRYLRKGTMMLERSFEELMDDPKVVDERSGQLLPRNVALMSANGDERQRARTVCDYLSSMSEARLTRFYQTIFESTGGSPLQ